MTLAGAGLALLAAVGVAALAFGAFMWRSMFLPTRGPAISAGRSPRPTSAARSPRPTSEAHAPRPTSEPHAPRRAVLVLDLQEGYAGAGARQPVMNLPTTGLFGAVNRVVAWAEASGVEVGYVTQVFGASWLVRLHGGRRVSRVVVDRRVRLVNSNVFEKRRTDAFASRALDAWLREREVEEVILTGVDAAYCVTMTARGALNRGYRVKVVRDAVASRHPLGPVLERLERRGVEVVTSEGLAG